MGSYSVVPCAEEHGTAKENFSVIDSPTASVTLRCAWVDRHALVADLLNNQRQWPGFFGYAVVPTAANAVITPFPAKNTTSGQTIDYDDALVAVNYNTETTDLFSEELEPNVEFSPLDYKQFRWGNANGVPLLEGEAPGRQVRGMNLVRTLFQQSSVPSEIFDLVGYVNNAAIADPYWGNTWGAETLLYTPPHLSRTVQSNGNNAWTIILRFSYKPMGWNQFWRAGTQAYSRIFIAGGAQYFNYPLGDFSVFF